MPKHAQHPTADLEDGLEHIVYEIWKYRQAVDDYAQIQRAGGDAALEFRVLHQRVLLEFFYGPAKHQNNLMAWEYVPGWDTSHQSTQLPWFDAYMNRCHTMLAHISTERSRLIRLGLKSWSHDWAIVEPHLDGLIQEFLGSLNPQHKTIGLELITKWSTSTHRGALLMKIRPFLL